MFTGLIQSLAEVAGVESRPPGRLILLREPRIAAATGIGDSVAVNGCCLTCVSVKDGQMGFEAGPETLGRTNLGALSVRQHVNVETSLAVGDALGGHFVTGHVDAVGILESRHDEEQWSTFWFRFPSDLRRQLASKGSIAVDGVSLTLVDVRTDTFSVALIPHTLNHTTLGVAGAWRSRQPGDGPAGQVCPATDRCLATWLVTVGVLSADVRRGRQRPPDDLCKQPHDRGSSRMSQPHAQTQSFLIRRFAEVGIHPNSKRGQNFLIDQNLMRLLVDAVQLDANDVVLEVGTGTGSLTTMMAPFVAAVVSVEVDAQLHQLATEELIDFENVQLLLVDVLRNKNSLATEVTDALRQALAAKPSRRLKLVANLPYAVATPVMSNLLASDLPVTSMTVTIQKELADRIMARPATKDYSAPSVWMQSQCRIELIREMAPSVFWPRPKVHSAIIHVVVDPQLQGRIADRAFFHEFVRAMFFHRRKFLRSELASAFKGELTKSDADEIMQSLALGPTTCAEELDVESMLCLAATVQARRTKTGDGQ